MHTMYELEFATFQGLKSYKLEFADKLVRSKMKKDPLQSLQPITSSLPKTWHVLMTIVLMNNTVNNRNNTINIIKEINIVVLYMYARTHISRGYNEVGFHVTDMHL